MSLIAWYPLNGNTNDYSGNNLNGTASNITYSNGKIGQAATYNTSQITILNNDLFKAINEVSLSAWINVPQYTQTEYPTIVAKGTTFGGSQSYSLAITNQGILYFEYLNQDGLRRSTQLSMTTYPINTWIHITGTLNRGVSKLYINGELLVSNSFPNTDTILWVSDNVFIGQNGGSRTFLGKINDVRIYNHALSEKEIKEIAKAKILHYTFDDFQEPTTNLYNVSKTTRVLKLIDANATLTYGTSSIIDGEYAERVIKSATTPSAYASYRTCITSVAGTKYTVSWWVRLISGSISTVGLHFGGGTGTLSPKFNIGNDYYFEATGTIGGTTLCVGIGFIGDLAIDCYIYKPQLEVKDHATPFVNISRTGTINDQSGFRNNATLTEATTPQWVSDSKIGSGAYKFNGSTTKFDLNNLSTSDNKITMSAWVYTNSLTKTSSIIRKNYSFLLQTDINGSFRPHVYTDAAWINISTPNNTVQLNKWQLLSAVYDGSNLIAYVDGVEIGRIAKTGNINPSSEITTFGYYSTTEWHDGYIDDIRIYSTALSSTEILELYQTRASVDNTGNLFPQEISEIGFDIDYKVNGLTLYELFNNKQLLVNTDFSNGSTGWSLNQYCSIVGNRIRTYTTSAVDAYFQQLNIPNLVSGDKVYLRFDIEVISGAVQVNNNPAYEYNTTGSYSLIYTEDNGDLLMDNKTALLSNYYIGNMKLYNLTKIFGSGSEPTLSQMDSWYNMYSASKVNDTGVISSSKFSEVGITYGLIAYYPFDKDARDYSGNGNHGTVSGAVLNSGVKGGAYSFDGISNYIEIPNDILSTNYTNFTMNAWIKTSINTANSNIMQRQNNTNNYSVLQLRVSNGKISTDYYNPSSGSLIGNITVNDNIFHMITLTQNGTARSIYIDGILDVSESVSEVYSGSTPNSLIIGADKRFDNNAGFYSGIIDEVRIYNRALSAEEISTLYETTAPSTAAMKITKDTVYLKGEFKEVI